MRLTRHPSFALLILLLCPLCVAISSGQSILGSISGTVTDQSGAVVPNATVVVTSLDRGGRSTATTESSGRYVVPSLLPGRYSLTVRASGFKTFVNQGFRLLVNEAQTINVRMEVGEIAQAVTVTAQPSPINQVNSTIATTVQNQELNELPLNGRHFTQLLALSTGVVMRQGGQQNSFTISLGAGGVSPVINGMRPQSNNFTLDGVENNSRFTNTYAESPPPDAIQEFKVETQDNDPQSALASGGGISVTTKSGSNEFHGTLWEYLRNDKLSANGFFNNFYGNARVPYKQNQYGLVFGGPVMIPKVMNGRRSQTYFFGYWEGFESRQTSTLIANTPDQAVRDGDFSEFLGSSAGTDGAGDAVPRGQIYDILSTTACSSCTAKYIRTPFPGNKIPESRLSPQAIALMNYFLPMPNNPGASPDYTRTANLAEDSNQYGVRVDHNFSDNQRMFARFSGYDAREIQPQNLPTIQFQQFNTGLNGVAHFTNLFSPTFLLDAQYGYNRTGIPRYTSGFGPDLANILGPNLTYEIRGQELAPQIAYSGSIYSAITPLLYQDLGNPEYSHQLAANFKKIYSRHELTFGFSYMRWNHVVGPQGNTGVTFANTATDQPGFTASGNAFASFLLGFPTAATNNVLTPLNTYGDVYVGYFGDVWRPLKNLSVNLGLQYVLATRPVARNNTVGMFDYMKALTEPDATDYSFAYVWAGTNPITGQGPNASPSLLLSGDHNNFAPRVGIAWSVTPNTVIRTGFGVYYDYNTNLVQNSVRIVAGSYPYGTAQTVSGQNTLKLGPQDPAITLADPFTPPVALLPTPAQTIAREMPDPYSLAWNFGVERLLPGNVVFDVHYVASAGKDLLNTVLQNIAPAGTGPIASRRPLVNYSGISWRDNTGFSTYNSLQVRLEKRYSHGLTFRNAFTWSRAFDTQSEANETSVEYVYNRSLSHGPSDYDQPLGDVATVVWELPFGQGKRWGNGLHGLGAGLFAGWQLAGLATIRSGIPYTIYSGVDNGNTGGVVGTMVANIVGNPFPSGYQTRTQWFDTSAFATPDFGTLGDTSRNMFRGPSFWDLTFSAAKTYRITERFQLQLRGEFFNALNHTNFGNPNSTLTSANFGQILSAYGGRDIQLALKLLF
jgi:Carboxypeptidase regulatory-like domain